MAKFYFIFIAFGFFALLYGCNVQTMETSLQCQSKGSAKVKHLKEIYKAGEPVKIKIETEGLDRENLIIVWDGKFGEQYFDKMIYTDDFIFTFPDSISIYSGHVSIKVVHCNKILTKESTYIQSLHPVGAIDAYIGPKTLAIDQKLQSMLCLIPTDKYGNAMENTNKVSYNTKYNNLSSINVERRIENLVSYIKIKNNQKVGKVLLGAKCVDTYIDEQEVIITQGPMQNVKLNIVEMHPYSDQRQMAHLNTDVIYDSAGNIVADGTSVIFIVHEEDEVIAQYQTYTVSGIANVYIENPNAAATWKVSVLGLPKSNFLSLTFRDNIESIPVRVEKDVLVVGPVVGSLDQYIPDGTKVKITFNYTISEELEIDHGFARLKIPDNILQSKEITCEVDINGEKVKLIY